MVFRKPELRGRPAGGPRRVSAAAERRRRNLTYLAGFIVVTFLLGLIPALRFLLVVNVIADVLLVLYLGAVLYIAGSARDEPSVLVEPPREAAGGWR